MPFDPDTATVQQALQDIVLQGELARGGQKLVFLAESKKHGRIAVKLIKPGSPAAESRAEREIKVAMSLDGPRFPRLFEARKVAIGGVEVVCIYEEFLCGRSLRDLVRAGRLSAPETVRVAREILLALQVLHDRGVVHRDVKPENVFVADDGRVVLLDFGIARQLGEASLTDDQAFFGPLTPGYGAPEQIRNEKRKISSRSDIFALGVVVYECFSGSNPFVPPGAIPAEALQNSLTAVPSRLDVLGASTGLADFVATCMEKAAHRRFASASEALNCLCSCPEAGL